MKITNKVFGGYGVAIVLIGIVGSASYQAITRLVAVSEEERHTQEVLSQLELVLELAEQLESGERGYIITGEESYLGPYEDGLARIDNAEATLRALTSDDGSLQVRLDRLDTLIDVEKTEAAAMIELRRTEGFAAAQEEMLTGIEEAAMEEARAIILEIEEEERTLLALERQEVEANVAATRLTIFGGVGLASTLLLLLGVSMRISITRAFKQLLDGVAEISRGGLDHRIALDSSDETGLLAKDFNVMAAGLQEAQVMSVQQEAVLASTADGIITIDEKGTLQTFNASAEKMFGYTFKEVVGQNIKMLMPSPFHEEHDGYLERYERTGEAHIIGSEREVEGKRRDKSTFPIALRVREMKVEGAKAYIGTLQDITQRQQDEVLRAAEEAQMQAILDSTADGIITIDEKGTVHSFNKACERMFGYLAHEVTGQNINMLMPSPYREEHDGYLNRYHRTGEAHIIDKEREVEGRRKDGSDFPLALRVRAMDSEGEEAMYIGMIQDITERNKLDEERQRVFATVTEVSDRLGTTSAEILASVTQQAPATEEQAVSVTETMTTADQVSQTASQSAEQAKGVAEEASRSVELGREGRAVVEKTVANMTIVSDQAKSAAESIQQLSEKAESIGEIITTVNEIANQTNLLALNAAIEASQGRRARQGVLGGGRRGQGAGGTVQEGHRPSPENPERYPEGLGWSGQRDGTGQDGHRGDLRRGETSGRDHHRAIRFAWRGGRSGWPDIGVGGPTVGGHWTDQPG